MEKHTKNIDFFNRLLVDFLCWLIDIRLLNPLRGETFHGVGQRRNNENILLCDYAEELFGDSVVWDKVKSIN